MRIMPIAPQLQIIRRGLVIFVDPSIQTSYPASGGTLFDISGNENDGTLVNGVGYDSNNGGSFVFDGNDDYIDFGDKDQFTFSSGFTIQCWVRPNGYGGTYKGSIISKCPVEADGAREFVWGFFNGNIYFWVVTSNIAIYRGRLVGNTSNFVSNNVWANLAISYNGGTLSSGCKIYINGTQRDNTNVQSASGTFTSISNTDEPLKIGAPNNGVSFVSIDARISSSSIYNRELSLTEIQHNFNVTRTRFGI